MTMLRHVRALSVAGLLAAGAAALPSLQWCPIADRMPAACEDAGACASSRTDCALAGAPSCDRVPDPLPFGDALWCIRPPDMALAAKADELPAPEPSMPLADLEPTLVVAPVTALARDFQGPEPGPPALRDPHGPPRSRAPPAA
jgi:hypothetical protein